VDQFANVIIEDSHERVYTDKGVEQVVLGLYMIRGDNIAVVGEIDGELDKQLDFSAIRTTHPLLHVVH